MPSKLQLDVNLWFLYVCLQKSDYKTIDFNAVGQEANINPPAARMRFTRLKKAIESGALNSATGAFPVGGMDVAASASLTGGHGKGKAQTNTQKRAKAPAKTKPNSKAKPATTFKPGYEFPQRPAPVPVIKIEIDDDTPDHEVKHDNMIRTISKNDDEDVPLAVRRRTELARKHEIPNEENQESKRRKIKREDENQAPATAIDLPMSETLTGSGDSIFGELGNIDGVTQPDGADWIAPYLAHPPYQGQDYGGAISRPQAPRSNGIPGTLPLRARQNGQWPLDQFQTEGAHLDQVSFQSAAPLQSTLPSNNPVILGDPSPSDTISISSSSPMISPTTTRDVSRIAPLQHSDTLCTRYPGLRDTNHHNRQDWRSYRLPHIVITDMEPHAPRNWINPHSCMAIGKAEKAVNEALFGPGSTAFGRKLYPISAPARDQKSDIKGYLNVPPVSLEENPKDRRETGTCEEPIILA